MQVVDPFSSLKQIEPSKAVWSCLGPDSARSHPRPQMAQLARELFALPKLKDSEVPKDMGVSPFGFAQRRGRTDFGLTIPT